MNDEQKLSLVMNGLKFNLALHGPELEAFGDEGIIYFLANSRYSSFMYDRGSLITGNATGEPYPKRGGRTRFISGLPEREDLIAAIPVDEVSKTDLDKTTLEVKCSANIRGKIVLPIFTKPQ